MNELLIESAYFGVVLSLLGFWIGLKAKEKWKHPLLNPLLVSIVLVISTLLLTGISYETYAVSGAYLSYLLTPATVCLAIPLYQQFQQFKENCFAILLGVVAGVFTNLTIIYVLSRLFSLDYEMYVTLLPKSITTAIGLSVSEEYGGIVSITAAAIIVTGILGNICGEFICKACKITNPVAKGVAMGTSAHAIGTSKAMEMGEVEGAMSSLSIVTTGLCTLIGVSIFANLY